MAQVPLRETGTDVCRNPHPQKAVERFRGWQNTYFRFARHSIRIRFVELLRHVFRRRAAPERNRCVKRS